MLGWLETAWDEHSRYLILRKINTIFDGLRSDHRFTVLLHSVASQWIVRKMLRHISYFLETSYSVARHQSAAFNIMKAKVAQLPQ